MRDETRGRRTHTHARTSGRCNADASSIRSLDHFHFRGGGGGGGGPRAAVAARVAKWWSPTGTPGWRGASRSWTTRGSVPLTCRAGDGMGRAGPGPASSSPVRAWNVRSFSRPHRVRLLSFSHLAKQSKKGALGLHQFLRCVRFSRSDGWSRVGTVQRATYVVLTLPPFFFLD